MIREFSRLCTTILIENNYTDKKKICIGRESNPGLAETVLRWMATANFTTKPPMLSRDFMFLLMFLMSQIWNLCKMYSHFNFGLMQC